MAQMEFGGHFDTGYGLHSKSVSEMPYQALS